VKSLLTRSQGMGMPYVNHLCLLVLCLVINTVTVWAQGLAITKSEPSAQHESGPSPLCDPSLICSTFTFANLPAGEQTVSLHFQNKGDAACRLRGRAGPSFAVDGHSMHVQSCWLCDENDVPPRASERESGDQILLTPDDWATLDLHWASTGNTCQLRSLCLPHDCLRTASRRSYPGRHNYPQRASTMARLLPAPPRLPTWRCKTPQESQP
jgi:hypothetical protein